jgi:1,4-dihydroxy-6-naphthoate synthase
MNTTVGYSSCPNDIFIFEALISGLVNAPGHTFETIIEDVEALNKRAWQRDLDVTKISFHAFGLLRESHVLLDAGSALGRGCGPLLIARDNMDREAVSRAKIAIPGELTTATLLLRLFAPETSNFEVMVFDEIIPAVIAGKVDAGLIIHESRFTFQKHGLVQVVDLGEWWEETSGQAIPLGGIIADRRLGEQRIREFDAFLRKSIEYAHAHPDKIWSSIRQHAQELDDEVIRKHIDLYVTDFTTTLGSEGRQAINVLFERAEEAGVLPKSDVQSFILS